MSRIYSKQDVLDIVEHLSEAEVYELFSVVDDKPSTALELFDASTYATDLARITIGAELLPRRVSRLWACDTAESVHCWYTPVSAHDKLPQTLVALGRMYAVVLLTDDVVSVDTHGINDIACDRDEASYYVLTAALCAARGNAGGVADAVSDLARQAGAQEKMLKQYVAEIRGLLVREKLNVEGEDEV